MPKYKVMLKQRQPTGSGGFTIPLSHHFHHDEEGNVTGKNYDVKTVELEAGKPVVLELDKHVAADLKHDPRLEVAEQGAPKAEKAQTKAEKQEEEDEQNDEDDDEDDDKPKARSHR